MKMKPKEKEIRLNWTKALDNAKKGTDLSQPIDWSFTNQDLLILTCLHEAGLYREKIEDLLEDCNFHSECSLLNEKNYTKIRKIITEELESDFRSFD